MKYTYKVCLKYICICCVTSTNLYSGVSKAALKWGIPQGVIQSLWSMLNIAMYRVQEKSQTCAAASCGILQQYYPMTEIWTSVERDLFINLCCLNACRWVLKGLWTFFLSHLAECHESLCNDAASVVRPPGVNFFL